MHPRRTAEPTAPGIQRLTVARSIELAMAGLVILTIAVAGAFSYWEMRDRIAAETHNHLRYHAGMAAARIEAELKSMTTTLSGLSRNTMLTNALMDSVARVAYVEPFLRDFRDTNGRPIEMTLVDFNGDLVSGSVRLSLRDTPHKDTVLQAGRRTAWLIDDTEGPGLVVAEPITYFRTTSPEGAFLYRISLAELHDDMSMIPDAHAEESDPSMTVRMAVSAAGQDGERMRIVTPPPSPVDVESDEVFETHRVDVGDLGDALDVAASVSMPRSELERPLAQLVAAYIGIGAAAIVLALVVSAAVGRRIARPLQRLEQVATEIVASGSLEHRFAVTGPGEIARLAVAFNAMMARLDEAQGQLSQLARRDTLTGLANRATFHQRLQDALATASRTGTTTALFLLDFDDFKQINDGLGHPAGDLLLRGVADRLQGAVRKTDLVARLGGDEFAIIATNHRNVENIEALARKIAYCFQPRFDLDGHYVVSTASIGVSLCAGDARTPDDLLREADLALYQVKAENGNNYCFFSPELTIKANSRKTIERSIRHLLATNAFSLKYQPKVNLLSGELCGCETLLRCPPEYMDVNIGLDLIPVAESSGLINPLGEWVLREACAQARRWLDAGLPFLPVAVNMSAVQLRSPDLVGIVAGVLDAAGLPSACLELEITETAVMERTDAIGETIGRLRAMGVRLSIDDFGTGYSSLTYLKRFPVQALKIDRSFVDGVASSADDAAIARAVIALGLSLGLEVIAEGVETEEQVAFLRAHGCQVGQGYLYSQPLTADALQAWWRARQAAVPLRRTAAG